MSTVVDYNRRMSNELPENTPRVRRSDATRALILSAARERFAADGYDRATIRAIADDAGVDPALVMRYYANKAGLFAAAVDLDLRLQNIPTLPRGAQGAALVQHFLERWEGDDILQALLRTAATNENAAERLRLVFARQIAPMVERLSGDRKNALYRAGLIASQALGFALCRYILRLPPVVSMRHQEIIKWLAPTIDGYLYNSRPG
jgi:AcrR family transcriptional regulator